MENLYIELKCQNQLLPLNIDRSEFEYNEEYDSITSLTYDLSESFYERGIVLFMQIGNHNCINLDAELSILLESFQDLVRFVTADNQLEYSLHFYEQGANRLLSFEKINNNEYTLVFNDFSIENFVPVNIKGTILDLSLILFTFFSRTLFLTTKICPSMVRSPMFTNWSAEIKHMFNISNWK